jgi:hypothetical protein
VDLACAGVADGGDRRKEGRVIDFGKLYREEVDRAAAELVKLGMDPDRARALAEVLGFKLVKDRRQS